MLEPALLHAHAERIRTSGVLGRSRLIRRLFEYLLDCTLSGKAPKEVEVAVEVFAKKAGFDVSQDAVVRVYVHKLRRKLEGFYAGPGRSEATRLVIPKGAYRFALEPAAESAPVSDRAAPRRRWWRYALAASVVLNALLLLGLLALRWHRPADELSTVRANPVWSRIVNDDRTIFLVVGDYYIFGETDQSMEVKRLVREFSINSPADLEHYLKLHPGDADRYLDLELNYLPTAAAFALRDVLPILAPAHRRIRVALASEVSPAILTSADVIYVGFLSGMGMMHDLVFAGSRFAEGESFDELVDRNSGRRYISQAAVPSHDEGTYHDYGYFATFPGPTGNQIVVIAGTRDVAVMHTASALTRPASLQQLVTSAGGASAFEALYEVYGMDRMNLDGKLLLTSALNTSRIWTGEPSESSAPAQHSAPASSLGPIRASR